MDVKCSTDVLATWRGSRGWYQSITEWRGLVTSLHHKLQTEREMRVAKARSIGYFLNGDENRILYQSEFFGFCLCVTKASDFSVNCEDIPSPFSKRS